MNRVTEFFLKEYKKLVRYVRSLIEDSAARDAEDIVQDVMVNIFDTADFTIPIENISAYIYRSLRNKVIDVFRKRKEITSLSELMYEVQDEAADTAREVEMKEIQELIFHALDSLNDEERALVIATEFEDHSFRKLSKEWEIPIGTLLARKSRALQKMRKKLTRLV